jgi:tRNA(fMet)-specific endonuclease VapC
MSARYLLDSDVLIAGLKGEPASLLNRLAGLASERFCLSTVVMGELLTGAEKGRTPEASKAAFAVITAGMEIIPFDAEAAHTYGALRATLERKGQMIGPLDLLIAAQAVSRELVLVSGNLREFRRVPGLLCENWIRTG